jgi:DNA-binding NarL/FixJ family response regulator
LIVQSAPTAARLALPSEPNGSRFQAPRRVEGVDQKKERVRILIVEDDFLIAMQTETVLSEAGYEVVGTASTADQAILLAREKRPALAVMDIRLEGERDGIDAAKHLFDELNIRCIFATAHDDAITRQRAEPIAPLGWLAKPFTGDSLVALVNSTLTKFD